MARKPRPSELAAKKDKAPAAKKAAGRKPAASKPGQKPVGKQAEVEAPVMRLPPPSVVKKLVATLAEMKKEAQSAAGDISTAIDNAHEKHHVDKKALAIVRGLNAMPINKLQITYYQLLHMMDAVGLKERADKQLVMKAVVGEEADTEDGGEAETETKEPTPEENRSGMRIVPHPNQTERDVA